MTDIHDDEDDIDLVVEQLLGMLQGRESKRGTLESLSSEGVWTTIGTVDDEGNFHRAPAPTLH